MRLSARAAETKQGESVVPGGAMREFLVWGQARFAALFPTVRIKLVALLCAIGLVIALVSSVAILRIYEGQLASHIHNRISTFTSIVAHAVSKQNSAEDAQRFVQAFDALPALSAVVIAGPSGQVLVSSIPEFADLSIDDTGWRNISSQLDASGDQLIRRNGIDKYTAEFARRIELPFEDGVGTIYVRINLKPLLSSVQATVWGLVVWLFAVVVVAVLMISLVMQRILVAPIETLRDFAERKGGGPLVLAGGMAEEISSIAHRLVEAYDATNTNEERLADLAQTDGLTGLGNRNLFKARLAREISKAADSGQMLGVIILNLDSFKLINDSLGHDVGDLILQRTADILRGCQRPGDVIARLGADEFGVVLTGLDEHEDSADIANRFIRAVGVPFHAAGHELHQTACVGLTVFPQDGRDADVLMKNADLALSRAKHEGSGACILYRHELHLRAMERNSIERDLRTALAQQQFVLFYQPKMDIQTGQINGAEALIRWRHPERGLVPPDLFIPVAERCGLISEVTKWVLDEACRQNRAWQDQGLKKISVAVNVSAVDLRRADLTDMVANTLVARGLSPQYLELEVTESMVMRDVDVVIGTLRRLRSLGVGIAIDDFGTGYSSLAYLKRFPVKRLKIDRSFISDIADGRSGDIIPKVIIDLAHALRVEVLAEGVEDMQQLEILRSLGCDEVQGYFLGKPMQAREFGEFLANASGGIHPRDDIRAFAGVPIIEHTAETSVCFDASGAVA